MKISGFVSIVLIITAGVSLSGCTHRNQQAWSDRREDGDTFLLQPSESPTPTASPTPALQEFIEQKMAELDGIDEELMMIRLDETE